jgi:hypothetical protein
MAWTTSRLNDSEEHDPARIARLEARAIDALRGRKPLRLHVVGDCRTRKAARIVSAAARRYRARSGKAVWTYTHAWRKVPRADWGNVSVLASCETTAEAKDAMQRGYAAAIVVPEFKEERAYLEGDVKVLPCPNQTRGAQCSACRLCMGAERLREAALVIAFAVHGRQRQRGLVALQMVRA